MRCSAECDVQVSAIAYWMMGFQCDLASFANFFIALALYLLVMESIGTLFAMVSVSNPAVLCLRGCCLANKYRTARDRDLARSLVLS